MSRSPCHFPPLRRSIGLTCRRFPGVLVALLFFTLWVGTIPGVQGQVTSEIEGTVRDQQGLPIVGSEVLVRCTTTGAEAKSITDSDGSFAVMGLQPGAYTVTVAHLGFTTKVYEHLDLTVNRQLRLDINLAVGGKQEQVTVEGSPPLLESSSGSTGSTLLPKQVESMPLNGRNYLSLLQLVPGVSINRMVAEGNDRSAPILGERANNAYILIDGMPNRDEVDGGPAGQFDPDSILEFQVITSGYNAEFGRGSGGIINVVTKNGTNNWHGSLSTFHRNYLLDAPDVPNTNVPFLLRWDTSVTFGGPLLKDRVFFFGATERIRESRESNFQFPKDFPPSLKMQEEQVDKNAETYETRGFAKFEERTGHHQLIQEMNLANIHLTNQGD